jgi:hypothetical protein
MTYVTGHTNLSASAMDLSAPQVGTVVHRAAVRSSHAKWPLWWTVLGVTVFCATFWTAFFSIIF